MPLCYAVATPSEKKIELHHLSLQIGPVMFRKDRHLRREADAVLTNLPPELRQRVVHKAFRVLDARSSRVLLKRNKSNLGAHCYWLILREKL